MYSSVFTPIFGYLNHISDVYQLASCSRESLRSYRGLNVWRLTELVSRKSERLRVFLNFYKHLPAQGSPAWLESKRGNDRLPPTWGGSEIGTLMEQNPYQRPKDLFATKLGMNKFNGNTATRWGNLFEEVAFQITDYLFQTHTYETGSIPGLRDEAGNVIQSYSPDRLGVIDKECFYSRIAALMSNPSLPLLANEQATELLVLMEGKCPLTRVPNDEIPAQYAFQPRLGAATIPITDICLFVDAMFRKCKVADFGINMNYDEEFHRKGGVDSCPLLAGFIGIYREHAASNRATPTTMSVKSETLEHRIVGELRARLVVQLSSPGSDFHRIFAGGVPDLSWVCPLCVLCDRYLETIYTELTEEGLELVGINDTRIIVETVRSYLPEAPRELIEGIVEVNYQQSQRVFSSGYHIDAGEYGIDYGACSERDFAIMLIKVIGDRFVTGGYKAYYSPGIYPSPKWQKYFPQAQCFVDDSEEEETRPRKWLWRSLRTYLDWCAREGHQPVGILPWKLFKISYIPVEKETGFLDSVREKIVEAAQLVQKIKDSGNIEDEFNRVFPSRRRVTTRTAVETSESTGVKTIASDCLAEFMDTFNAAGI
jgi:hypothetical protein